jgi:cytochrome oxidase Cu insertion factor (SCO1/SenC/PrrC family)
MRQSLRSRLAAVTVLTAAAAAVLSGCGSTSGGNASGSGATGNNSSSANTAAEQNPNLDIGSPVSGPAPDFTLTNQFGQKMSLSQFKGKVILLSFEDSQCTDVCPLTSESELLAKEYLGKAGENVQLLGVDANPMANKVSDVMSYTRAHGLINQWDFLTGSDTQLKAVWKAYHIADLVEDGSVTHTPALYVVSQQGTLEKLYITQMAYDSVGQSAQVIAQEVSTLLPSHPKLLSQQSLAAVTPYPPSQPVTAPSATGSGTVSLGGKKARVVVFFTTWLDYVSNLKGELTSLNSYAKAESADHLPPVTAVDETTTEPSDQAVASYLKSVGTLDYPVALDKTGRIADGFQAQDQPWLAVVNSSGKIAWQHDGWVSLSTLEAAAKKVG